MMTFNRAYRTILESYSPHKTDSLVRRLQSIDPEAKNVDSDELRDMYNKFHRIIKSPYFDKVTTTLCKKYSLDLGKYFDTSYEGFEQNRYTIPSIEQRRDPTFYKKHRFIKEIIDYFPDTSNEVISNVSKTNIVPIYDNEQISIFQPKTQEEMIRLGKDLKLAVNCVHKTDISNSYNYLRYSHSLCGGYDDTPSTYRDPETFYIVHDKSNPSDDISIIVSSQSEDIEYIVATNTPYHNEFPLSWDEILEIQPRLKGLQHLFKFVQYTKKELQYLKTVEKLEELPFDQLSEKQKIMLLNQKYFEISIKDFAHLNKPLRNLYINRVTFEPEDPFNSRIFTDFYLKRNMNNLHRLLEIFDKLNDPSSKAAFLARYKKFRNNEYVISFFEEGDFREYGEVLDRREDE